MVTERVELGKIEILVDGQVQIRTDTVIERDGVEISRLFHRSVLEPSDNTDNITDARLKSIVQVIWTSDVIKAFEVAKAEAFKKATELISGKET